MKLLLKILDNLFVQILLAVLLTIGMVQLATSGNKPKDHPTLSSPVMITCSDGLRVLAVSASFDSYKRTIEITDPNGSKALILLGQAACIVKPVELQQTLPTPPKPNMITIGTEDNVVN